MEHTKGNYHLAAAAPDLLAICETIRDKITDTALDFAGPHGTLHVPLTRQEVDGLRAAIAKAKGVKSQKSPDEIQERIDDNFFDEEFD